MSNFTSMLLLFFGVTGITVVFGIENNDDQMKTKFKEWKICRPGFLGLGKEGDAVLENCHKRNVLNPHNCFVVCVLTDMGVIKDGKWDPVDAKKCLALMWDAGHQAESDKWVEDTQKCADEFEAAGKIFPAVTAGECSVMDSIIDCVHKVRRCP